MNYNSISAFQNDSENFVPHPWDNEWNPMMEDREITDKDRQVFNGIYTTINVLTCQLADYHWNPME